jgi:NAD(P)-dependent dehydrogenase (short-subunit alcohol dehydrogenase family)
MPIVKFDLYHIDTDSEPTQDQIIAIYNLVSNNVTCKKLTNFLKRDPNPVNFKLLMDILPYNFWLEWYKQTHILRPYWTTSMILKLIDSNSVRIINGSLNNTNIEDDTIILNNQYDDKFNFIDDILNRRLSIFKRMMTDMYIDPEQVFGGFNIICLIGNNENWKKFCNHKISRVVLDFYPKECLHLSIPIGTKIIEYDQYMDIEINRTNVTIIIRINRKLYSEIHMLVTTGCFVDFNTGKIRCNALIYQRFVSDVTMDEYIDLDVQGVTKYITDMHTFKIGKSQQKIKGVGKTCYQCKKIHSDVAIDRYKDMCLECGIINYTNRIKTADLTGFTAFITGIRVKIGFATSVKILRNGGNVIGTSRFPNLAIYNYSTEKDYDLWKDRITIIKCDFTDIKSVYKMLALLSKYKINAFINNAFRTIRASDYYNKTIIELDTNISEQLLIKDCDGALVKYTDNAMISGDSTIVKTEEINAIILRKPDITILTGFKDVRDVKHTNSWDQKIDEVDPKEIVECVAINQLIPTLIINSLKPMLITPKFIINVSSLEGQFNTIKQDTHVHTNMCKAALNMLIRTLSEDPDKNLHVHCIDPGYVSGVCAQKDNDEYPMSIDDASSRILYPIISLYNGVALDKRFVKMRNYNVAPW